MLKARFRKTLGGFTLEAQLNLERGINVLRGESGAGKTTVANLLSGAMRPDDGEIELEGLTVYSRARRISLPPQSRGIGFVFQSHRLFPHLTVRENILFPSLFGGRKSAVDFDETIEILGLEPLLERLPSGLSGGEAQRVALGRALMGAERLLILDEPLSSLDPRRRHVLMDFIDGASRRMNVPFIYITHSEEEMMRLADRAFLVEDGTIAEIPRSAFTEVTLS